MHWILIVVLVGVPDCEPYACEAPMADSSHSKTATYNSKSECMKDLVDLSSSSTNLLFFKCVERERSEEEYDDERMEQLREQYIEELMKKWKQVK
jgi:hypothetical protein